MFPSITLVHYQVEMMRNLRKVNIDHLHVGWYQSTLFGGFINKAFLESQYSYQHSIEESVVLMYGKYNLAHSLAQNFERNLISLK